MFRQVSLLTIVIMPIMVFAGGDDDYFTGDGTSYTLGQVSSGNCNFMYDPGVGENYAALNAPQWSSTHNCGRCAEVSCIDPRCSDTTSTVVVHILDKCSDCQYGNLELSPATFKKLTNSDPSRYKIQWKFVDCPVSGNIRYCTKSGSSSSWLAVQPANFVTGIASMKIANQEVTMVDSCFYYLLSGGANVDMSAVNIELTSVSGETITEVLSLAADTCSVGASNFGSSSSAIQTSDSLPATVTSATTLYKPATAAPPDNLMSPTAPATAALSDNLMSPTAPSTTPTDPSTSYTFINGNSPPSQQQQQEQSELNENFSSLPSASCSGSSCGTTYESGVVLAFNETKGGQPVAVLQSDETGVKHTLCDPPNDPGCVQQEHVSTQSATTFSSTSPLTVAFIILVVVGGIVLAAFIFIVQKKKMNDKRVDRDLAMMRSFDTFSSPVCFEKTIAKI